MKYMRLYVFKFVDCSMVYSMQHRHDIQLRQHTTPPSSFAKRDLIQSRLTSQDIYRFGFQLNELPHLKSRQR